MKSPNQKRRFETLLERVEFLEKKIADRTALGLDSSFAKGEIAALREAMRRWRAHDEVTRILASARRAAGDESDDPCISAAEVVQEIEVVLAAR